MAIPLPGSAMQGFAQGFGGVNNVFKDLLQRKLQEQQLRQQMQNHEDMLKQQALDYALRQHADTRAGAASERNAGLYDLNRQLLQAKTGKAISDTAWNNMLLGGNPAPTGGQPSGGGQPNPQQFNALKDVVQNRNFAGGGAFPEQQQQPQGQIQPSAQQAAPEQMQEQENGVHVLHPGDQNREFLNKFAGFKGIPDLQTHYDNNGNLITKYPNGKITIEKVSPSSTEQARSEALAKSDVKHIEGLENTVLNSDSKRDVLDELSRSVADPLLQEMRQNPLLGKYELQAFSKIGTPEQQKAVGKITALMGDVIKSSSRDFAGQFRQGEQQLLENMKPVLSDTIPVMQGKLEALTLMLDLLSKRSELEANYIRQEGKSPLQARELAAKNLDTKAIRKRVDDLLYPEKKWSHLNIDQLNKIAAE